MKKLFISILIIGITSCSNIEEPAAKGDSSTISFVKDTIKTLTRVQVRERTKASVQFLDGDIMKMDTAATASVVYSLLLNDAGVIQKLENYAVDSTFGKKGNPLKGWLDCTIQLPVKYAQYLSKK